MDYIHHRLGGRQGGQVDAAMLRRLTAQLLSRAWKQDYLQEAFGLNCVDVGEIAGKHGNSLSDFLLLRAQINAPDPVASNLEALSDLEVLALHEVMFDVVSAGVDGHYHSWNQCGWHYGTFDPAPARTFVRETANDYLRRFGPGYRMNESGRIEIMLDESIEHLISAPLPDDAEEAVQQRVRHAITAFRRGTASWPERRVAVRELADVLEDLRSDAAECLGSKDEADLFQILNRFSIRHANKSQQSDYNKLIFLTWTFHVLLAGVHATLRLRERERPANKGTVA